MNKKRLRQFIQTTLRIIIPHRLRMLFKNKLNNGEDLTREKLNLEIEKRKRNKNDTNSKKLGNKYLKKRYVFISLIFAVSLRFSYRIGYFTKVNEIQAKEIVLRSLRVQIFDDQTKLEQKIYQIQKLNDAETSKLNKELTTSEISKINAETQLKLSENRLAKEEEKLTKVTTEYTKVKTRQLKKFNWSNVVKGITVVFSLRYALPTVWQFFTSQTEDPLDFSTVRKDTPKNLTKNRPSSRTIKSYMGQFFKNKWDQFDSWFTRKDEVVENKSKIKKSKNQKSKNQKIYDLNSKEKPVTESLGPQHRLAIEPLQSIKPEIVHTENEEVVETKFKKPKSDPFKEYREDMAEEKVYPTRKKNNVEMYRRSTSAQFWNGFGPFYPKSTGLNLDIRKHFTPEELRNMGYKMDPKTGEVEGKSILNRKPFEIVSSKELRKAKQERKKELSMQQSLDSIGTHNSMTNLSTKFSDMVEKSKKFMQNPFNSK